MLTWAPAQRLLPIFNHMLQSNEWTGKQSFGGRSLHHLGPSPNPYEEAMVAVGKTLATFDDDQLIPAYGFGDGEQQWQPQHRHPPRQQHWSYLNSNHIAGLSTC